MNINHATHIVLKALFEKRNMNYLTVDESGEIEVWENKPECRNKHWSDLEGDSLSLWWGTMRII